MSQDNEAVPPAGGEVEVLGYSYFSEPRVASAYKPSLLDMSGVVELVDRAHVTRLQADLASANADKEAYAQNAIDLRKQVDALKAEVSIYQNEYVKQSELDQVQSELTKARELLDRAEKLLRWNKDYAPSIEECCEVGFGIAAFLAHQSAPAVSQTNNSGKAHCPHCGICHTSDETCEEAMSRIDSLSAPAAKGGE